MRTFAAPVKEAHVVLGHLGANLVLGSFQITLFLLITKYALGINWGMPLVNVFFLLMAFLVTALGLGIGLAGFVQDAQKFQAFLTLVAMPTSLLGGGFFPMEMLPASLQQISPFIP